MDRTAEEMRMFANQSHEKIISDRRAKSFKYALMRISNAAGNGKQFVNIKTSRTQPKNVMGELAEEDFVFVRDELIAKGYEVTMFSNYTYEKNLIGWLKYLQGNAKFDGYTLNISW